jgi:lipid-A-disaccharide synthase
MIQSKSMKEYIYVSAGEASGDLYGGSLIAAMRTIDPGVAVKAMGGSLMSSAGAEVIQPLTELQMIGTLEVVPKLVRVYRILNKLKGYFAANPPALAVLIDFPDFHFQLGKFLRNIKVPIIYYVSPQIWAWRSSRITTIKALVETMIPLYEFEYKLYQDAGIPVFYTGHPLLDIVKPEITREEFYRMYGISEDAFILGLMPGSRIAEIERHMPTLLKICNLVQKRHAVTLLLIKAFSLPHDAFNRYDMSRLKIIFIEDIKYTAMKYAHLLLVSSGTATVEGLITETPMIVFYKLNKLSWILGRWLVRTRYLAMVNIIAGDQIVPEYYQDKFQAEPIAELVNAMIENPSPREQQKQLLVQTKRLLGSEHASQKTAEFILSKLKFLK